MINNDTGSLSFYLCIFFILASIFGIISVYLIIKNKTIENENIDKIVELGKWFLVSIAITLTTSIVNDGFRERDQDIKEAEVFDKYVQTILTANGLEQRKLLCDYFAAVSPSGPIKDSWVAYKEIVNKEIEANEQDKTTLAALKAKPEPASQAQIETITSRIEARSESLAPKASSNLSQAKEAEINGYTALINKDFDAALVNFQEAENYVHGYHFAYEISRLLRSKKNEFSSENVQIDLLREISNRYASYATTDQREKLNDLAK